MKITTKPKTKGEGTKVRPGDDLEVTITTTDPQGKPVAAELSLAMIEQSLLERFASPLPSIGDFFRGGQRATGRPLHVEHHLQLPPCHAADQPAADRGKGPRGNRQRGRGKPAGGDCGGERKRRRR